MPVVFVMAAGIGAVIFLVMVMTRNEWHIERATEVPQDGMILAYYPSCRTSAALSIFIGPLTAACRP